MGKIYSNNGARKMGFASFGSGGDDGYTFVGLVVQEVCKLHAMLE